MARVLAKVSSRGAKATRDLLERSNGGGPLWNTVGSLDPTATQNSQARCARNAEGRRKLHNTYGAGSISLGHEKGDLAQDALPCPRSFPFLTGSAHRRCRERPFSASFCVADAKRPPAYSASLLDLRAQPYLKPATRSSQEIPRGRCAVARGDGTLARDDTDAAALPSRLRLT